MRRLLVGYVDRRRHRPAARVAHQHVGSIFEDTLGVLALGLQTLPSVCWVPLALLWFGQTEGAMLFVVVMGTVWSVIIATDTGARTSRRSTRARRARWARKASTSGRA